MVMLGQNFAIRVNQIHCANYTNRVYCTRLRCTRITSGFPLRELFIKHERQKALIINNANEKFN